LSAPGRLSHRWLSDDLAQVLDHLCQTYPQADVAHAFASAEADAAFGIGDSVAFFRELSRPTRRLRDARGRRFAAHQILIELASLSWSRGRSAMRRSRICRQMGSCRTFVARRCGIIDIGGQKVHPEQDRSDYQLLLGRAGAATWETLRGEILNACRGARARHRRRHPLYWRSMSRPQEQRYAPVPESSRNVISPASAVSSGSRPQSRYGMLHWSPGNETRRSPRLLVSRRQFISGSTISREIYALPDPREEPSQRSFGRFMASSRCRHPHDGQVRSRGKGRG
jgi:hypothetical protein